MPKILSRKAWTTTSAKGAAFSWGRNRGLVDHYPAAGRDIGVITQAQEASRLRGWRNYHVNGRGWADIGYNYGIGQSGRIWSLRGNRAGAHATGHNSTTVGILFIVGDNEPLTEAAKQAHRDLLAHLRRQGAGRGLWGHQQMSGASTRCPGPYIMGSIRDGSLVSGGKNPTPTPAKDWFDMATADDLRKIIREEIEKVPAARFAAWTYEDGQPAEINIATAGRAVQKTEKISREARRHAADALTVARQNRDINRQLRTALGSVQAIVEALAEYEGVDRQEVASIVKNAAESALADVEITLASVPDVHVDDD